MTAEATATPTPRRNYLNAAYGFILFLFSCQQFPDGP